MLGLDLKPIAALDCLRYSSLFLDGEGAPGYYTRALCPEPMSFQCLEPCYGGELPRGEFSQCLLHRGLHTFFPGLTKWWIA